MKIFVIHIRDNYDSNHHFYLEWKWEKYPNHCDILDIKDDDIMFLPFLDEWFYTGILNDSKVYGYYTDPKNCPCKFVADLIPNGFQDKKDIDEAKIGTEKLKKIFSEYNSRTAELWSSPFENFYLRKK